MPDSHPGPDGAAPPAAAPGALPIVVVIVSYNRCADLRRCLGSLGRQRPGPARVMVVDNGSMDGTVAMVRGEYPWVELLVSAENLGPCIARNAAVLLSGEPILWFLDSDTEVVPANGAARLHALFAAPDVVAAGGEALLDAAGGIVGAKRCGLGPSGIVQGDLLAEGTAPCQVISSCNLMVRRDAFLATGGFDPFYFFFYEDIDVTWRLNRPGARQLVLAPMPVVHHFSERMRVKKLWLEARNRMYFCLKNLAWWRILLLPANDLRFVLDPGNFRRLARRAGKSDAAKSLVTLPVAGASGGGLSRLRRLASLGFGMAAKLVLTYVALPLVLRPALRARHDAAPLTEAAIPAGLRAQPASMV
jgi:GT2 family glycosyltransferase